MLSSWSSDNNGQIHMSAAEYRAFLLKQSSQKTPKHRNKKVYVYTDGFISDSKGCGKQHGVITDVFDSEKEYTRYCELSLLCRSGKISGLKKQVPFVVYPEFVSEDGKKHRAVYYNADFVYVENGKSIVEDVKGLDKKTGKFLTTQVFNLKWKILQSRYPEYLFRLY